MILSNTEILKCLGKGDFLITPHPGNDTTKPPYNSSAIDLKLGNEIRIPKQVQSPVLLDLSRSGISNFLYENTDPISITKDHGYTLRPNLFVLGITLESVDFPMLGKEFCYSARVEGKSSLARCGVLIHFTAPTIHAGFKGPIALEIINLGIWDFQLTSGMFICQLIIEQVHGNPRDTLNQFSEQKSATGKH